MRISYRLITLVCLWFVSACSLADNFEEEQTSESYFSELDPYESFNRRIFAFNDVLDENVAVPLAEFYQFVTPSFVDKGVTNFFSNLNDAETFLNSLLQGKFHNAMVALNRFIYNSTFGIGGLFDVATSFGLEANDEDFGQTLGYWGYENSSYLVIPILGPSTFRDFGGTVVDFVADPVDYIVDFTFEESVALKGIDLIDTRADLLAANNLLFEEDKYAFMRSAYLQNREFLIKDGEIEDPFSDDEFDYEDF
jgi:phospholipid-binding lipoprotein MlaA